MANWTINVDVDSDAIMEKINSSIDESTMQEIHALFAKTIDPWVPFMEGVLSQSVVVTPEYVMYPGPYAHYQYVGTVYERNIPIIKDGILEGWFSPPGEKKKPTDRELQYTTDYHPKASAHWDKAAMAEVGDTFANDVHQIIKRKLSGNG